jgi:DNA-binding XRE family transcriptional regulator
MTPILTYTFEDWQKERLGDPEFVAEVQALEPGYQIARLRLARGLTQAQLAEMVGTKQPSIARLEKGETSPDLAFLKKLAGALGARIEVNVIPLTEGRSA